MLLLYIIIAIGIIVMIASVAHDSTSLDPEPSSLLDFPGFWGLVIALVAGGCALMGVGA